MDAVVAALGLKNAARSTWADGIQSAYSDKVFVTQPLGEWILAAGCCLFYTGDAPADSVLPVLRKLSEQFGEAQYFLTHRVVEAHVWARACSGRLMRGFGYVGESGEVTWNQGTPTEVELELGEAILQFPRPNEDHVMRVAAAWSVNPCELESQFTEPGLGQVGVLA